MAYVDGFVAAVATATRDTYLAHAGAHGRGHEAPRRAPRASRPGATTCRRASHLLPARGAAARRANRSCWRWVWWPDQATRDAGWAAMENDSGMTAEAMPFDGKRMIFGGFEVILEA